MPLFTPAWKGKNEEKAIKKINSITDQELLFRIATDEALKDHPERRSLAIERIKDLKLLVKIALNKELSDRHRSEAVKLLWHQKLLSDVAIEGDESIALEAVKKITDQQLLSDVAIEGDESIALEAVKKITDQQLLTKVAKLSGNASTALTAIKKIDDQNILRDLVSSARLIDVRAKALHMFKGSDSEKESLSYNILPQYGISKYKKAEIHHAFYNAKPEDIHYLEGYEDALLKVVTTAEDLTSRIKATTLLSEQKNKDKAIWELSDSYHAEEKLTLALEKSEDEKEKEVINQALDTLRKREKDKETKRLIYRVINDDSLWALSQITDDWALKEVMERILIYDDAYYRLSRILSLSSNEKAKEYAKQAIQGIEEQHFKKLRTIKEQRIKKLRTSVITLSGDYCKAAVELVESFHMTGTDDPELKDAYCKLLNSPSLDTRDLVCALGEEVSDIDVVYPRLIEMANSCDTTAIKILANYPTALTIETLYNVLRKDFDHWKHQYIAARAAATLKKIYSEADENIRGIIEKIPQKEYHCHYDIGKDSCHGDYDGVSFFLD